LKQDAIWLELLPATNDHSADTSCIANFQRQLRAHGLGGRYCLLYQNPSSEVHDLAAMRCIGISKRELRDRLGQAAVAGGQIRVAHPGGSQADLHLARTRAHSHDIIADIDLLVIDRMEHRSPHDPPPVSQNVRGLLPIK